jgi:Raf kinase inhibitor-like YbhB/YbcL family protein
MSIIISAVALTACGDDDGDGDATPVATETIPSAASPTPEVETATAGPTAAATEPAGATLTVSSTDFSEGETIPDQYTCNGANISPPLSWEGAPPGTQSFAVIMDDPDAPSGDFVHWVLYDIAATTTSLQAAVPAGEQVPGVGTHGVNGANQPGYIGACPPSGEHRYQFKVYALDGVLGLAPRATKADLLSAMEGRILAQGQLVGLYASTAAE